MKKGYNKIVKAIEVTKKYNTQEIQLLSGLFSYLNNFDIDLDDEGFGTGVSAKGLWKLLNPLTKNGTNQTFEKWWNSVSNTARLKENIDFEKKEETEIQAKSTTSQKGEVGIRPVKKIDYILTLRAGEYFAVLTKGDSGDLYRRFIFDIKDEFLRLVFRYGKSIETRSDFTKSIGDLDFMKKLKIENKKSEMGNIYGEMTNLIYLELFGVILS
ncbi:antA/AntB antirepressor family protein [Candidatus Vampirococcus lugosii]|uniref:Restriction endonuclease n=1 Tax=Candidatus Vampirococcus lugosii TaxID=2789015 RepID=A0ABS5QKZ9_9BACT|nr:antA/AntB antirepressor family protein [Candidatus Vampirococcus lugosii]MBS8121880.1 hypothetical protein [Candidatus Vampirococcus lugosii]